MGEGFIFSWYRFGSWLVIGRFFVVGFGRRRVGSMVGFCFEVIVYERRFSGFLLCLGIFLVLVDMWFSWLVVVF